MQERALMIAIHIQPGSFSDRWVLACKEKGLPYVEVDAFAVNLLETIKSLNISIFLYHPPMGSLASSLLSKSLSRSLELSGVRVFPNDKDIWHFDDKLAQKYMFEATGIDTPKTWVFFDRLSCIQWLRTTKYPKVFKLRSGAGSTNVKLIKNYRSGAYLARKMFGKGLAPNDNMIMDFRTKIRKHQERRDWMDFLKRAPRTISRWINSRRLIPNECGYFYVQEFLPKNDCDTRITIIGNRAFGFRRMVRPGDFRASGSGFVDVDPEAIDLGFVEDAFKYSKRLGLYCAAFDFIYDRSVDRRKVVEVSFGFKSDLVRSCPGYWSSDLRWNDGSVWPEDCIVDDICKNACL